jgi:hypothetical protein
MSTIDKTSNAELKREGNLCLAIGSGVGALGIASAVLAGAVCPLCYIVPPALIGIGAFRRYQAAKSDELHAAPKEQLK